MVSLLPTMVWAELVIAHLAVPGSTLLPSAARGRPVAAQRKACGAPGSSRSSARAAWYHARAAKSRTRYDLPTCRAPRITRGLRWEAARACHWSGAC